ncbi:MAG: phage tail protein [Chitinophagaceae bacterium]
MNEALFTLGDIPFTPKLRPISGLSSDIDFVWAVMSRINMEDSLQPTGVGSKHLSFNGVTFPTLGMEKNDPAGTKQIQELEELATEQLPQPLIDGMGNFHGFWAITKISEDKENFLRIGAHLYSTYIINLTRVPMDSTGTDGDYRNGAFNLSKYRDQIKPFLTKLSTLFN